MTRALTKAEADAYGDLLRVAAELVRGTHTPSEYWADHQWCKSTPLKERRRIMAENAKACEAMRRIGMRIRDAADKLAKGIS